MFEKFIQPLATRLNTQEIIHLYCDEELTLQQVGDRYGVTRERIRQILDQNNIPRRTIKEAYMKARPISYNEVVRLYVNEKQPLYKIAKRLSASTNRVKSILAEQGENIRTATEARILTHPPKLTKERLYQLYVIEKKSQAVIGELVGYAQTNISSLVKRWGLQKQSQRRK